MPKSRTAHTKREKEGKDGQVVLGIDPGMTKFGWGVVLLPNTYIASGVFKPPPVKSRVDRRIHHIYTEVRNLVKEYKPDICAIESQYFFTGKPSGLKVAQAKGAAIAGFGDIDFVDLTPAEVKMAVTGYGAADKEDLQETIAQLLVGAPKTFKSFDESDALAIAWSV